MKNLNLMSTHMAKYTSVVTKLMTKAKAIPQLPKKWLASGAVVSGGALVALTLAFAYPANTPPGIADLVAVVTQTAAPNTPGSTSSFKTGDQIQFMGAFKAPAIPVPQWESHVTEFGAGQLYVNGSTLTPPGYKASYLVGSTWQTAEPASGALVTKIKYTYEPTPLKVTPAPPGGFITTGAGDGYQVLSFKERIYLVNHHEGSPNKVMKCYASVGSTSNECPGWAGGLDAGAGIYTATIAVAEVSRNSNSPTYGRAYYPAAKQQVAGGAFESGFGCFDLLKAKPCDVNFISYFPNTTSQDYWPKVSNIMGLGVVEDRLYALEYTGKILCLNVTTGQKCSTANGENFQFPGATFSSTRASGVHDNSLPGRKKANANYIFVHGDDAPYSYTGSAGGPVYCFNATTNKPCSGTWPVLGLNNAVSIDERIITNDDGSFKAVCLITSDPNNARCFDAEGKKTATTGFAPPNGFPKQFSYVDSIWGTATRTLGYTTKKTTSHPTPRRRIYTVDLTENILCYDEADAAPCAGFSMSRANFTEQGKVGYIYSITHDPERDNCLWTDSDSGIIYSFDALTGGFCTAQGGKIVMDSKPIDAYKCDPASANITGWDAIVTSGEPTNNLKVKIYDALTTNQIGTDLTFPSGQKYLDISNISYTTYPHLTIEIQNNGSAPIDKLMADVTWKGSPKQFCSRVTAGADCVASAKFTGSSTDNPNSPYTELVALNKLLIKDQARQGFGAGSAVSNTEIKNNPLIFRGTFDEVTLSGDLTVARYEYKPNDTPPTLGPTGVIVSASTAGVTPAPASRNVITQLPSLASAPYNITSSIGFDWAALDASQRNLLSKPAPGATSQALDAAFGQKRLNYLRGDAADEISSGGKLRSRTGTARTMGMVLASSLVYLPTNGSMGYSDAAQPGYSTFALANNRTKPTVFVNANDGMLHAYTVNDQGGTNVTLKEQFAYLPNSLLGRMTEYTDKSNAALVQSPYFNDSTPMVADVKLDTGWATVLASAFGRGNKGLYMLNVTKADSVTQANPQKLAIREFTDANDPDMGFIVSQPEVNNLNMSSQIVQVKSGSNTRPAVIVGNGINSTNGVAALFVIYLDTTGGYLKIPMPATPIAGVANGLSTPRVLTGAVTGVADRVYAGDLYGNMWAIDISNLSTTPTPYLLFNAGVTATGKPIPIATAPTAMRFNPAKTACANCWMVNFATGKPTTGVLLYDTDIPQQTAYGVWDKGSNVTVLKTQLAQQLIVPSATGNKTPVDVNYTDITKSLHLGWYMDLPAGQMTVANPFVETDGTFVMFTIKQAFKTSGICTADDGDYYQIIASNGKRTNIPFFVITGNALPSRDSTGQYVGGSYVTDATPLDAQRGPAQVVGLGDGATVVVNASGDGEFRPGSRTGPKRISWREIVN